MKTYLLKTLLVALCLLSTTIATAHDFEVDGIFYNITDETAKAVEVTYKGNYASYSNEYSGEIIIPATVTYDGITYNVTSIGYKTFYYNANLTSITISGNVTSIKSYAFFACSGLTSITIPNNVTSIGECAFSDCSNLTTATIGNGVTTIESYAFFACSGLTSITIPNSVTSIGKGAFSGCSNLTTATIGNGVTTIESYAFYNCKNLVTFSISSSTTSIGERALHGTAWYENQPDGILYVKNTLYGYKGTMPRNTNITIKAGTINIIDNAFSNCTGLESVTIPNSIKTIGKSAFQDCTSLKEVHISDLSAWCKIDFSNEKANPLYYARCLFINGKQITELAVPSDITEIKDYAFNHCSATNITIPSSVTVIGNGAFNACYLLTEITIPNSVATIGASAFYGCKRLTNITVGNGITAIGSNAFAECYNLKNVYISDLSAWCRINFSNTSNPLYNGRYLYLNGEKIINLVIPNDITEIKNYTFTYCTGLTSVTIPKTVKSIGDYAFDQCHNLKIVYNNSSLAIKAGSSSNGYIAYYANAVITPSNSTYSKIGDFVFSTVDGTPTLVAYIGNDAKVILPQKYNGKSYTIGKKAFYHNSSITSITIPNTLISIGDYAFDQCHNLKIVYNNSSLAIKAGSSSNGYIAYYANAVITPSNSTYSTVGDFVFNTKDDTPTLVAYIGNIGYTEKVTLPQDYNGLNYTIGEGAFSYRNDITGIAIPSAVTNIESGAFSELKEVHISDLSAWCRIDFEGSTANPLSQGADLYLNNRLLTEIVVPSSISEIKKYAFFGSKITSVTIPDCVTIIGKGAFWDCDKLANATIGNSVTTIGKYAFENCTSLASIKLPNSLTTISNMAFYKCALTNITIPESVTTIKDQAFQYCYNLKTVYNNSSLNFTLGSTDNGYVAYYADVLISKDDDIQGDYLFKSKNGTHFLAKYLGSDSIITLPADYNGESYILEDRAFSGCITLTNVTIPNSIKTISKLAFYGCTNLQNITIPSSVTLIDSAAFCGCSALKEIKIPNSVTTIGEYALRGCSGLTSIEIPYSVKEFQKGLFYECSGLESVKLSDLYITTIPNSAFYKCSSLKSIKIPSSVTSIASYAFQYCSSLTSISIPASVTSIGNWVFSECNSLQDVIFEDGSTTLNLGDNRFSDGVGGGLFDSNGVKRVYIGRNLSYYAYSTRWCCAPFSRYYVNDYAPLEKAIIGPQVTNVPRYLFQDCKYLKTIISYIPASNLPTFDSYGENFVPADVTLYVPISEKETYTNTEDWNKFGYINEMITIGDFTYGFLSQEEATLSIIEYNGNSTEVNIPEKVNILGKNYTITEISNGVFYNKNFINSIKIPDTVYKIGENTLHGTAWWESQPNGVVYAGKVLYQYKGAMPLNTSIIVKEGTKGITAGAFKNQYQGTLTKITIPSSLKTIGKDAFLLNFSNYHVRIQVQISNLSTWCNIDFDNQYANPLSCSEGLYLNGEKITNLVIPSNITEIKDYAFYKNDLIGVTVVKAIPPTIYSNTFSCYSATLYVPAGAKATYAATNGWKDFTNIVEIKETYNVTFIVNDSIFATDSIVEGEKIIYPEVPEKEGHTFSWDSIIEIMPSNDITITGKYVTNSYLLTYKVDGEVYASDSIEYGATIEPVAEPVKEGYTFSGWSEIPATMPAVDVVIEGSFTINSYTVTFMIGGEVYETITVEYGSEIELPTPPEKEGYIFSGWVDVPATMPAEDIVIEGNYVVDTTGIGIIEIDLEKNEVYNLKGQRITETENLTRGIYIVNGKKVLVK